MLMARNREADEEPSRDTECAGQLGEKTAYSATAGFVAKLGDVMIRRKVVIAGVALGVIVAFAAVSQPVQAGG
jgi:hypothetical protein